MTNFNDATFRSQQFLAPIQMQADKMIGSFRLKFSKAMVVNQLVDRWYVLTEKPVRA